MAVCFVRLALLVASADGEVTAKESQSILGFFRKHGADNDFIFLIQRALKEALKDICYDDTIRVINEVGDKEIKLYHFVALLELASVDGRIDRNEVMTIAKIMKDTGFSENETKSFFSTMITTDDQRDERRNALTILGLREGASKEDIKRAYRDLVQKYHPDKVAHLGPEFSDLAHSKFQEIANAYGVLTEV